MSAPIRFILNGEPRSIVGAKPTTTVLEHLRRSERLTGTKEGCAEGDCGACTVLMVEPDGAGGLRRRAVNSCIQFVPSLQGRAIETVEHLGRDGPHPIQTAMVETHASQCGFCTPGFVMQLHAGWLNGTLTDRQSVKDSIAGNLCRCTGYGPIVEAGLRLAATPQPETAAADAALAARLSALKDGELFRYEAGGCLWFTPDNVDALADIYAQHPDAVLVAGATDVGLWVTKQRRELPVLIDVSRVADLRHVEEAGGSLYIGAAVTHREARDKLAALHPALGELVRRFAGAQIRNAGTVGGYIANGSPIGDLPPALIALGSQLHLRRGDEMRALALEDFFLAYGRQDRAPGEFVAAVEVPGIAPRQRFFCHKISKRFDSDISAVLAALLLSFDGELVVDARLAFGGMAATPKRALGTEAVLLGRPFDAAAVEDAAQALAAEFTPLDDMRASAAYRLSVAQNVLRRFRIEYEGGTLTNVLDVA